MARQIQTTINNLTDLISALEKDPTLSTTIRTTTGVRVNPLASVLTTAATQTVSLPAPTRGVNVAPVVETELATTPEATETLAGTTSEVFAEDLNARLTQAEADIDQAEASITVLEDTINSQLVLKAPLASPALTGTPTAPTATAGANTTQIATTQFVTGAITTLVDGAPAVLDTLNEIAASLGDDSNFAGTITETLALKAPLDSPSFTGPASFAGATTFSSTVSIDTPLDIASGGTGGSSTSVALNNLLPSGETAGYVLKTNGPGSYFWDAETGASLIVGTRINTSRTFFTATASQTVFTGIGEYTPGAGQLRVYLDGVRQFDSEYTETSSTSFTLDVGVPSGTIVLAEVDGFVSYPVTANAVSVTPVGGISATDVQNALAGLDGRAFIAGMIIMWSGTIANIPSGWALCDGTSGTPDLRNRMIIGANADDAGAAKTNVTGSPTLSGGSKDAIIVEHTHTTTGDYKNNYLDRVEMSTGNNGTNQDVPENGTFTGWITSGRNDGGSRALRFRNKGFNSTALSLSTTTEGSTGTDANLPPYYALAFIMKL
jgi:hypothetical protein